MARTALRMCYGFLRPDAGQVRIAGHDLAKDGDRARRALGVCTQDDTFDSEFTVRANLVQTGRYYRPRQADLLARIDALLERFGLGPFANQKPETLSGGYKRRLMIARAVVHQPRVAFRMHFQKSWEGQLTTQVQLEHVVWVKRSGPRRWPRPTPCSSVWCWRVLDWPAN